MCSPFDALPPELPADLVLAPMAGGAGAERVELMSGDATRFMAAFAEAAGAREVAVVVLPDVRGLYPFYVALAERFAEAGHHAIAIDYFGRTAGIGDRGEDFDFWPHVLQTRPELVRLDAAAAIEALRSRTGASRFVTVGFCFGGSQSFAAATDPALALDGAVGFYGALAPRREGMPDLRELAVQTRCPVLGLFGGGDESIPAADVATFERALQTAGLEHEIVTYSGAPHSFFDRSFGQHAEACEDAWRRVLAFLSARSGS
jgi:carboxymethylenebutenolidase